eukprot:CAMPEP_0183308010 /NCGR_PEP_ID=MMETSP0160_2-20130417/19689_1 /TAXON_ID=2839 ORGANISM="Odontella Sinensis, Strain Grunow 1884" /NCGR_SAMPLE_ID=MMETSP0160_2 /ASSEMBLY_ACC=CAM_ASM_000250 /LENGTH=263 /DNA_ID=CAMNT_0025471747 /DNA_START=11 /DNA_END=802 /DNA_ORIENTATION=-
MASVAAASLVLRTTAAQSAASFSHVTSRYSAVRLTALRSMGHTVRVILKEDLPDGKGYSGDIMKVRAGYARNYLIPKKMALYAIPENFERLGIKDPEGGTMEERRARKAKLAAEKEAMEGEGAAEARAADLLRQYLRKKVLKIWRNIDTNTGKVHPGLVNHINLRQKISKQLRIDLEDHEMIHIRAEPVLSHAEVSDQEVANLLEDVGPKEASDADKMEKVDASEDIKSDECQVEIRQLGDFLAKITLRGGHTVPLRFTVVKR